MIPIYNISDFPSFQAIDDQFMLERFESLQRPPKLQWPHKHSFYEIMWLTSGTSVNVIDYHQVTVEPDMLFFISPGQLHLMNHAQSVKGFSLTFTESFLLINATNKNALKEFAFLDNSYASPFFKLDSEAIAELSPILELMMNEVIRKEKSPLIIANLLFVYLNRIQRLINQQSTGDTDPNNVVRYKLLKKLIEDNFKTQNSIAFYADKLNLTSHRVNEICKAVTGKAVGVVIRDRVLLEAKRLLVHSEQAIGQIGDELGFRDFSYFSRQFKRQEGLTPAEYRKTMHGKYQSSY
ncbi:helix-turn-helix domain-containing protein [Mucilaginibacter terrae]|uniref:AraC family transcriptional activator of pobA n=1 Tax=Mucilaginibacter terrae TaxID=1955052 RepID=A0ABU3H090_9SPHI|nr:helix-turn-helix transcriptional regulator [Mucilaginibacter terrae]MDT3405437.1 AraC family transcriptional activator of pobA [Mucilaginibacter terrae]